MVNVLKGILSESEKYYRGIIKKVKSKLSSLPKGSIKKRLINGNEYYYIQYRNKQKVVQKYLGSKKPNELAKHLGERKKLIAELKKSEEVLEIIKMSKGKKILKKCMNTLLKNGNEFLPEKKLFGNPWTGTNDGNNRYDSKKIPKGMRK